MILRNQGVSRYLSSHRAPSEAEEALSFSPSLTIWCWMLLVPQSISLPSPLLRRSISKARYSKQGRALRERQGRDLFKSCPRPAETPLVRPLTPASHDCSRFPRLGAPALTLIPLFTSPPLFFPSAQMEASWRQVAGGRGRARGRATAAPSSGNGIHLRGAGGGRGKGSVGAGGPGCSPGGAATAAAAGTAAPRDLKHRGLP